MPRPSNRTRHPHAESRYELLCYLSSMQLLLQSPYLPLNLFFRRSEKEMLQKEPTESLFPVKVDDFLLFFIGFRYVIKLGFREKRLVACRATSSETETEPESNNDKKLRRDQDCSSGCLSVINITRLASASVNEDAGLGSQ
ncbi:hypothetical protein ACLOJK_012419 [Asimina triloba]